MAIVWIILAGLLSINSAAGSIVNIAFGKPVTISSKYRKHDPSAAVDGNTSAVFPGVMHTDVGKNYSWWLVDLKTMVQDATVKIYFRTDYIVRRNGLHLYTSTMPYSSYPVGQLCHTVTGLSNGRDIPDVVSVNCTGIWRYLLVYTQTDNDGDGAVLDFGEVEVLGCNETYGDNCDKSCSSRQCGMLPTSCNRYTGACPPGGCKTGWKGSDCTIICPSDTYGPGCNSICGNCFGDDICDHVTGNCPGDCKPGWLGIQCNESATTGCSGSDFVSAYVIGAVIGTIVTLVVNGGILFCLVRQGRLKWHKLTNSEDNGQTITMNDIYSSTVAENISPISEHTSNDDYSILDPATKADNKDYDAFQEKHYENT